MTKPGAEVLHFGPFELDIEERRLQRNGLKIGLEEKSFRLLSVLVRRADETVTRDELQKELWPDGTHLDFRHGLNNAVNKLRSALGDSAETPRFVATIPKVGYRFIASVRLVRHVEPSAKEVGSAQILRTEPSLTARLRSAALFSLVLSFVLAALLTSSLHNHAVLTLWSQPARLHKAAEAYAVGIYYQKFLGRRALSQSKESLEQAVALDPGFAEAHAALALTEEFIGDEISYTPAIHYASALAEARRALDLDDSSSAAHVALGNAKLRIDWDWKGAEQEYVRALEFNPSSVEAVDAYARLLGAKGQRDSAVRLSDRMQALDPSSTRMLYDRAVLSYLARDYGKAIDQLRLLVASQPDFPDGRKLLSDAYAREGHWNEASAELLGWLTLADPNQDDVRAAHRILREQGLRELWRQHARGTACHANPSAYGIPFYRAAYFALLNEKHPAMEWLHNAYAQHDTQLLNLKVDPRFDALRSDPEFSQLLQQIGLTL